MTSRTSLWRVFLSPAILLALAMPMLAQSASSTTASAYVYVSSRTTTAAQQSIHAYAANPYGTLTTVQGSPFTGHALTTS